MTSPRALLAGWQIHAKKQLGQNFLSDPSSAEMIVRRSAIGPEDVVLEIGAGLGALTIPAAKIARKVVAVETDRRLIRLLQTELQIHRLSNVEVITQDILKLDLQDIAEREGCRLRVLGNLPYHISSQILIILIAFRRVIDRCALMFQKELARRIAADPGGKDYGRISVMIQYCAAVRTLADIPSNMFFPRPKVDSQVLEFKFHHPPIHPARDETLLFDLIKAAFSKRRKTLKNALAASELQMDPHTARSTLENTGIHPQRRAETLTVAEFVRLSDHLAAAG